MVNSMELEVWPTFDHPNVLTVTDVVEDPKDNVIFLTPLMGTTLFARLHDRNFKKDPKALERCRTYGREVLTGLSYLHRLGFCHLDLRAENILLALEEDRAVIGDFSGLCISETEKKNCPLPNCFRPPELIGNNGKSFMPEPVDLWSYGLLLANLFLGAGFYCCTNQHKRAGLMSAIQDYKELFQSEEYVTSCISLTYSACSLSPKCVQNLINVIQRFLRSDPAQRVKADEALSHPFFINCPVRRTGNIRFLIKRFKGRSSKHPMRKKKNFRAVGKRMISPSSGEETDESSFITIGQSEVFDVIEESSRNIEEPPSQVASAEAESVGAIIWSSFKLRIMQLIAPFLSVPILKPVWFSQGDMKKPANLRK